MDEKHYLSPLFEPRSVAIIGATERDNALGAILVRNMLGAGFKGALHAVNPKYDSVQGVPCFAHIGDVPGKVDLAVIATPAGSVPGLIDECGRAGVKVAAVLSAGFGESGTLGAQLEEDTVHIARQYGMRVLGPNSLGVARPLLGLNATFAGSQPIAGSIGFVSQSGALCAAVLDYARPNQVGFSNVISLGVSAELDFGEILDYLVWDFRTEAILVYIEGIRDARRFLSAIRAAARAKPVMVLKVGRHPVGSRAAQAHTGAVTGDDAVFDAALRRSGVIRLNTLTQLFSGLKGLFVHFRPRGNRLAIITNGGGPGVMAADRAGDLGIELARLAPDTIAHLEELLPSHSRVDNPIDLIGDSSPERYASALQTLLQDEHVDGVLCLLSPLAMSQPSEVARRVVELAKGSDKPILTCWLGDDACLEAREIFRQARIPSLRTPESAVDLFSHISSYYRNQQLLTQVPAPLEYEKAPLRELARSMIESALKAHRTVLRRHEAIALLAAFHIPVTELRVVHSPAEGIEAAMHFGFPVDIKPDAALAGTRLQHLAGRHNLASTVALHLAYEELTSQLKQQLPAELAAGMCIEPSWQSPYTRELMLRVWRDPVFGPVIGIGERSLDPNYWPDRAVGLPPLNAFLVRDLLHSTHAERMLGALDGMPAADLDALEHTLLRVSDIICEMPWIRSLEINPLCVDDRGLQVADARIEIGELPRSAGRYDHMAIHPYPSNLIYPWQLKDGALITIRPIKPEDAEMNQAFVRKLSPETKYFRFMSALRELSPSLLAKLTQIDYDRELAFIATHITEGSEIQIGVCRYTTNPDGFSCEFAIVVDDTYQHSGLGRKLMEVLVTTAWQRGLQTMKGEFLANNERMLRFVERIGFVLRNDPEDKTIKHGTLDLAKANQAA
ncbi:bifunctional acetyl coenzyme A synthetase (ADP forming), alpha domain/GNAT family N-acetyltransferase [Uliginosibacterium sp. 31-12]|uniref:bifunctional acetate--CoA ligase family protein/GNAT family N-acetyltransferase n=1 Tax=Uliginosibacterium sp. 31-12 TaxID=3062781 RepID=UPI0026E294D7|nr:bifunctional acetyl coenzyme A synthetase (ADP forming), alpha domain/GNAT family N-acetyltransferase [Uliginosibacterium sp. 31-12]MDO6388018.1 GNAT family N-acetyltransferase [Uliginosibacterium sp. 31-12]